MQESPLLPRINELARKKKNEGLSPEEAAEQQALRAQYLKEFRKGMQNVLDHTSIQYPDGSKVKLKKR